MSTSTCSANVTTPTAARYLRRQLQPMIDNEDWNGIFRIAHDRRHNGPSTGAGSVAELLHVFTANKLQFDILQQTRNQDARNLLAKLVFFGGKGFAMEKDEFGCNLLHRATFHYTMSHVSQVVSQLVRVGGRELVLSKNDRGFNSLHAACQFGAPTEIISMIVEAGGREVILDENKDGRNSLQIAFNNCELPIDVVDLLIEHGGVEGLIQLGNTGNNAALISMIRGSKYYPPFRMGSIIDRTVFLIIKGIELQVGGEYAIGGLFNCHIDQTVKDEMYNGWNKLILPALEQVLALPNNRHLPIVHAVIMDKAHPSVIDDVVNRFEDSINITDSFGKYPIDVAVNHSLAWDDGMKAIVEAFATAQQTTTLHVCAKHGVQWENGMKEVLERSNMDVVERVDDTTGLYQFMVAAVGEKHSHDLGSIYHLIKKNTQGVRQFGDISEEGYFPKKRKRR